MSAPLYEHALDPVQSAPLVKGWECIGWRHAGFGEWVLLYGWTQATLNEARHKGRVTTTQLRIPGTSTFALYLQRVRA